FGLVAPGNNDRVAVTGTATFGPGVTITPTKPVPGTHTLVTAGELTGTAPTLNAPTGTRSTFALQFDEAVDQIRLVVTGDPKTLTKAGAGKLTLSTNNTYAGATQVQDGTLVVGSSAALPTASTLTLGAGATSGVLDLNGFNVTVGGLATAGAGAANMIGNGST